MKKYRGYRSQDHLEMDTANEAVVLVESNGNVERLALSAQGERHSPTGFNWGYGGSGPAALAHSILADAFGTDVADWYYQAFKFNVIANLEQGKPWELTEERIRAWLDEQKKSEEAR